MSVIQKVIIKEIKSNIDSIDRVIACNLKKKYPKYFGSVKLDTLRRRISVEREEKNLKRDFSYRKNLVKDIHLYCDKYKDDTRISIAKKLHLKYPIIALSTIRQILYAEKHWNSSGNN